jgi:hypothetical protein
MFRSRREAITDAQIRTGGISLRSLQKVDYGTHAHGAYGGTITFRHGAFVGTPTVLIQPISGYTLGGGGTQLFPQVRSRYSGSFTYYGTPRHGTFQWVAIGSFAAR